MALLVTKENRPVFVPAEQAKLLWLVFTGERKATAETRAKVKRIAKWYLNRDTAPASYLAANPKTTPSKYKPIVTQARLPYVE